uniref:Uncharacterized protein n=1 Tax=Acrobeloides nanus TaxID=290746 RepID=A0A914CLF0_9BILA
MSALSGCATLGCKWLIVVRLLSSFVLLAGSMGSTGTETDQHLTQGRAFPIERMMTPKKISFVEWVQQTTQNYGMFLNHSSFIEGEVLLFRTKKNRHRAIPVMKTSFETSSKFSDALTFKEFVRSWLHRINGQEK